MSIHARRQPEPVELEYQPVWTGASWREVLPSESDASLPDYSALTKDAQIQSRPTEDYVAGWLTDEPRSTKQAAADLKLTYAAAANLLFKLAIRGLAVRTWIPAVHGGRAVVLYARAER